jgi:hypothetical protein
MELHKPTLFEPVLIRNAFAAVLAELLQQRKELGMPHTWVWLSEESGVPQATLGRLLTGETSVKLTNLINLSQALAINPSVMINIMTNCIKLQHRKTPGPLVKAELRRDAACFMLQARDLLNFQRGVLEDPKEA